MNITSATIDENQISTILSVEESHFVELKAREVSPASITKAVSAFANAAGGELYIGIDERIGDTGTERIWRGFEKEEEANALIQVIEAMWPLGNHYSAEFLRNDAVTGIVLHLTIFKTKNILKSSDGTIYVRRSAQKLPVVGAEAEKRLSYDKGITSFEDELLSCPKDVISYSDTMVEFILDVVPTQDPEAWAKKQMILLDEKPTVSGIMLFADEPQAILPKRSAIKIFRYKTKSEGERDTLAFDPITVEGPAYKIIYTAVQECRKTIESIQKLGPNGLENVLYPDEALHEIITNAVLHRDYSIISDVQVRIFDNRIEIESPGRFPGHVTPNNVLREQYARNPKIVRLVNKFPNPPNKDVGEGLNTAFEAMNKLRLKPPIIEERENSVLVILRHESLGSPEQLVMEYLNSHPEITNAIGRELTGIKSENSMKNVFYRLRDRNLIEIIPGKFAWQRTASGTVPEGDPKLF